MQRVSCSLLLPRETLLRRRSLLDDAVHARVELVLVLELRCDALLVPGGGHLVVWSGHARPGASEQSGSPYKRVKRPAKVCDDG